MATGAEQFEVAELVAAAVAERYGHLLPDSEEYLRGLLDNYDAALAAEEERGHDRRRGEVVPRRG